MIYRNQNCACGGIERGGWMKSFESMPIFYQAIFCTYRVEGGEILQGLNTAGNNTYTLSLTHTHTLTRWTDEGNSKRSKKESTSCDFTFDRLSFCMYLASASVHLHDISPYIIKHSYMDAELVFMNKAPLPAPTPPKPAHRPRLPPLPSPNPSVLVEAIH